MVPRLEEVEPRERQLQGGPGEPNGLVPPSRDRFEPSPTSAARAARGAVGGVSAQAADVRGGSFRVGEFHEPKLEFHRHYLNFKTSRSIISEIYDFYLIFPKFHEFRRAQF